MDCYDFVRKDLNILFWRLQPEKLFPALGWKSTKHGHINDSETSISEETFVKLAFEEYPERSFTEIRSIYAQMTARLNEGISNIIHPTVLQLIVHASKLLLTLQGDEMQCKFGSLLTWNALSLSLGQDLFTCAYLAWFDLKENHSTQTFLWAPILHTDYIGLNRLLGEGLAENHMHLGGSTQSMPISWACLMNHPERIANFLKYIPYNLQSTQSRGETDNVLPLHSRLMLAAGFRAELTQILMNASRGSQPQFTLQDVMLGTRTAQHMIEELRHLCPVRVKLPNEKTYTLDYAMWLCAWGLEGLSSPNRLLGGERAFLYLCFQACFTHRFTAYQRNLFYTYLLIKSNFRRELIQSNGYYGFENFHKYQDRKAAAYDKFDPYLAEATFMGITGNIDNYHITNMEARITPAKTKKDLINTIKLMDKVIFSYDRSHIQQLDHYFYTLHFVKRNCKAEKKSGFLECRNASERKLAKTNAMAIEAMAASASSYNLGAHHLQARDRIWGIDAASMEIYCRPETFATVFRYLRNYRTIRQMGMLGTDNYTLNLKATYHVGEDFMDLADGLRAIDEAIQFLDLHRGERIGHGLALAVNPYIHYQNKQKCSVLPQQYLLDNITWLLFRSCELGCDIPTTKRNELEQTARSLLRKIYLDAGCLHQGFTLQEYYESWKLRGDDPVLYRTGCFQPVYFDTNIGYTKALCKSDVLLDNYRNSKDTARAYYEYHFNPVIRQRGDKMTSWFVDDTIIEILCEMQRKLAVRIQEKGIMIECNPTSNVLIGTFREYKDHPIFRLYSEGLPDITPETSFQTLLNVSINTDDLGVMETSLANEYALIAAALSQRSNGTCSEFEILRYLQNIRIMGHNQSFHPIQP